MSGARRWLSMYTGERDGQFNMRFDLQLVNRFRGRLERSQTSVPILRFYEWKPYCISIGRNQAESDIDVLAAKRDGIDIVRRPTGGKAVLHAEELTYSVVMETGGLSVIESYNMISGALVDGLRTFGVDFELSKSSADFRKLFHDPATIPCFSTSAIFEVEYHGKKLVGSAQRRFGEILLQHGSILIGDFHKRIVDYLAVNEDTRVKTRDDLAAHTTTLNEILGRQADVESVIRAIESGFERSFDAECEPYAGSMIPVESSKTSAQQ